MKNNSIYLDKLKKTNTPVEIDFSFTDEEKDEILKSGVLDVFDPQISYTLQGSNQVYVLVLEATCTYTIIDNHNLEPVSVEVSDTTEITIDEIDEENSDVEKGSDGRYDLRSSIFSLLYYMIPFDYSSVPLSKIETSDFTLMSEAEYQKEKKNQSSPFNSVSLDDFEIEGSKKEEES